MAVRNENKIRSGSKSTSREESLVKLAVAVGVGLAAVLVIFWFVYEVPDEVIRDAERQAQQELRRATLAAPNSMPAVGGSESDPQAASGSGNRGRFNYRGWWNDVPDDWLARRVDTGTNSNIRMADLAGPDSCRECHEENHDSWSRHGHSRMTAFASEQSVVGDFSGKQTIEYDGGRARFYRDQGRYMMELVRAGWTNRFQVTRTIGWRHFQDYAGILVGESDPLGLNRDKIEHVLPFAFDVAEQHFMPPIHVWGDFEIPDSFAPDKISEYTIRCADCHMAYPVGDRMIRRIAMLKWAEYAPRQTSFNMATYFADAHPEILDPNKTLNAYSKKQAVQVADEIQNIELEHDVPIQGITCEACHYGCREHVENSTADTSTVLPAFYPISPHLIIEDENIAAIRNKSVKNINFMCARCHSGQRQEYANGLHAWNSTEATEAMNGSCYDSDKATKLGMTAMSCVHCHNPHETVGLKWAQTPQEDDARCLSCHSQFEPAEQRRAHTHHATGDGSHCMDCHMPHTNEGLGRMVRTHRIANPMDKALIEANQANACNLCHLDKSIDWTIKYLKEWYDPDLQFSESLMAQNYKDRSAPVVHEWISGPHPPTRIAAAGAIGRRKATFAISDLLDQLTVEDYGYNKRVMQKVADEVLGLKLREHGFKYHLPSEERQSIMKKLKPRLLRRNSAQTSGRPIAVVD